MKVKEVIARINNGESITDIAKEFHVSRDTMNRRLNALGYEWNNSEKKRVYVGQNPEPDLEINEVINGNNEVITGNQNGNTIITKKGNSISELKNSEGNKKVIQGNKERNKLHSIKGNNEVIKGNPFTDYEVMALKEIVKHWRKGELEASASLETSHDIRELDLPLDRSEERRVGKECRY